jgi:nicotinate-nucleotide pyrophosphorylase (carboxylating)
MPLPPLVLDAIIECALREDLAAGDVTTDACVAEDARATADAVARHPMVVCGGEVFARVFAKIDAALAIEVRLRDGERATKGAVLWRATGRARSILMGERTALNLTQRLSGIATLTRRYVDALAPGTPTRITDTRKTTPGLRALERYAVRVGGGRNHRDNLGAAVLIKDNHVAASGGVRQAIERARAHAPHTSRVECEVDSLDQLDEALAAGADIVLLDNMDTPTVAEAVRRAKGKALTEASGGITLERITELSRAGVDAISCGALTHSAPAADIGLDFR